MTSKCPFLLFRDFNATTRCSLQISRNFAAEFVEFAITRESLTNAHIGGAVALGVAAVLAVSALDLHDVLHLLNHAQDLSSIVKIFHGHRNQLETNDEGNSVGLLADSLLDLSKNLILILLFKGLHNYILHF